MQLTVIKADGTQEKYLHTKVMACLVNAFGCVDEGYVSAAEELAETVTFYLYNQRDEDSISSGEIFSIILAVLSSTGYGFAAESLSVHNQRRNLLRTRIEVTKINTESDRLEFFGETDCWNKSKIVHDLQIEQKLDVVTARTIASIVEEKIINSGIRNFTTDFIKFLVISQMQAIISAQQQLKISARVEKNIFENEMATDGHLRQSQKGLCPVEV
jgi:transcriptional regulator NrdR family protein